MHRVVGLKVWSILILVLLSGWGELTSEAQLLRGRRQRNCCCPAPCNPCSCEPKDADGMCVMDLLYSSTGYYLYYAHHHENGTECPFYEELFYESSTPLSPVPMLCWEECFDPVKRAASLAVPGLPNPLAARADMVSLMPDSAATKLDELAGNLTLPDGRKIHARIGLFKVKAPVKVDGAKKEVWEYFGFGFEAEETNKDEFHAREIAKHKVGAQEQKYLTEFKIGSLKSVVLTVQ